LLLGDFFKIFSRLKSGIAVLNRRRSSFRLTLTVTIMFLIISMVLAVPTIAIAIIMTPLNSQTKVTMMEKRINSNNDNDTMEWNKTYGRKSADEGNFVIETADGGYIITGTTVSHILVSNGYNVWLIKTNSIGDLEWNKTYGGIEEDYGACVVQTIDGGYIITGNTYSYGSGYTDVWLIKTDASGDEEWNQSFGGTGMDSGRSAVQTSDVGYIITGSTESFATGGLYDTDVWLIKTDETGNIMWDKTYGGAGRDEGYCVAQTADGGYIITGTTGSFGAGYRDVWLIKTDENGDKEWDKTYGGTYLDEGRCVQQTSDEGYIITGIIESITKSSGTSNYDVWLIKTDENGNEEWKRNYGGTNFDMSYCVEQTTDSGYIITGCTYFYDEIFGDVWLIKTDEKGNYLWDKTFGGLLWDEGRCVVQTSDGGFIITGSTTSFGAGSADVWLIKVSDMVVDSDGKESSYSVVAIYIAVGVSVVMAAWLGKSLGRMMGLRRKKLSE